jgi:PEP-CTERM motif-containing protein
MKRRVLGALAAATLAATLSSPLTVRAQDVVNSNGGDGYLGTEFGFGGLFGSDNAAEFGSGPLPNVTTYDWISDSPGLYYIGWGYLNFDVRGTGFDSAGFILDGVPLQFSGDARRSGGVFRVGLGASDTLGVYVSSLDSEGGRAFFSFSEIPFPEPATWALMVLGVGAVGGALRRRSAPNAQIIG